jgi:hypothetical protein
VEADHPSCRTCRNARTTCDRKRRFLFDLTQDQFFNDFDVFCTIYERGPPPPDPYEPQPEPKKRKRGTQSTENVPSSESFSSTTPVHGVNCAGLPSKTTTDQTSHFYPSFDSAPPPLTLSTLFLPSRTASLCSHCMRSADYEARRGAMEHDVARPTEALILIDSGQDPGPFRNKAQPHLNGT